MELPKPVYYNATIVVDRRQSGKAWRERDRALERVLHAVCLLLFLAPALYSDVHSEALAWEYRWDQEADWRPTETPSNPAGREDASVLWLRTNVPDLGIQDPALFIYSIDTAAIVYLEGARIYAFPDHEPGDRPAFAGWPWHMIRLSNATGGEELTIRVFSEYRDIGLWGTVRYGNRADLQTFVARRDLVRFLSGTALLAVGIVALLAFLFGPARRDYLFLILIVFLMTIRSVATSYSKQLLDFSPLFWQYVEAASAPALFALVAELLKRFLPLREGRFYRLFALLFWIVAALTIVLPVVGALPLYEMYPPQDILFVLFWLLTVASAVAHWKRGNRDGLILLITFVLAGLVVAYSIPVSYSLVPWTDSLDDVTLLIFALGLSTMVGRRFSRVYRELRLRTKELEDMNTNLEKIVDDRTEALEEEKRRFQELSTIDYLTGLYNRRQFSELTEKAMANAARRGETLLFLIFDIDHFKNLNDTFGHPTGDVVLRSVASVLRDQLRTGDLAGRFGGDEFVALLGNLSFPSAEAAVERLRTAIRKHDWFSEEYEVTISCGAVLYDPSRDRLDLEQLLSAADRALYQAKRAGRDQSCLVQIDSAKSSEGSAF